MKFSKAIMNPPYQNGLYLNIMETSFYFIEEDLVSLCPKNFITDNNGFFSYRKKLKELDDISENSNFISLGFDIDLQNSSGLGIFTFNKEENSDYYKSFNVEVQRKDVWNTLVKDNTSFDRLKDKFSMLPKFNSNLKLALTNLSNPRRKELNIKINKNTWYIGLPMMKGHRDKKSGKVRWDYFTYLPLKMTEPLKGKILGDWNYVMEFTSYEEGKEFIDYLNSDIAMYMLWLFGKNNTNLSAMFSKIPLRADSIELTNIEKESISKVMEGFGNKYFIETSLRENGKVNYSTIYCELEFDYTDSVGTQKKF